MCYNIDDQKRALADQQLMLEVYRHQLDSWIIDCAGVRSQADIIASIRECNDNIDRIKRNMGE